MRIDKLERFNQVQASINELQHELKNVNDLLTNAKGNCTVKINTRWIIQLPVEAIKEHAKERKKELEQQIENKEKEADVDIDSKNASTEIQEDVGEKTGKGEEK